MLTSFPKIAVKTKNIRDVTFQALLRITIAFQSIGGDSREAGFDGGEVAAAVSLRSSPQRAGLRQRRDAGCDRVEEGLSLGIGRMQSVASGFPR
jgi:hypothetical protein